MYCILKELCMSQPGLHEPRPLFGWISIQYGSVYVPDPLLIPHLLALAQRLSKIIHRDPSHIGTV